MNEETYIIKAKSSSGDFYEVTFTFHDGKVRTTCSCAAGGFNQMCKHKDGFLLGDETLLFDASEKDLCAEITQKVGSSEFPAAFENLQNELHEIESEKKRLSDRAKQLKKDFGRRLFEGI